MDEFKTLSRMRTIPKALNELKKTDPDTSITYALLKSLCEKDEIKCVKMGNRFILNLDSLIEYLSKL